MKAELKASGTIVIRAENELEAYALRVWGEEVITPDGQFDGGKILVDFSFPAAAQDGDIINRRSSNIKD